MQKTASWSFTTQASKQWHFKSSISSLASAFFSSYKRHPALSPPFGEREKHLTDRASQGWKYQAQQFLRLFSMHKIFGPVLWPWRGLWMWVLSQMIVEHQCAMCLIWQYVEPKGAFTHSCTETSLAFQEASDRIQRKRPTQQQDNCKTHWTPARHQENRTCDPKFGKYIQGTHTNEMWGPVLLPKRFDPTTIAHGDIFIAHQPETRRIEFEVPNLDGPSSWCCWTTRKVWFQCWKDSTRPQLRTATSSLRTSSRVI